MRELTARQKEIYDWMMENRRLVAPTIREAADHFGFSVKGIFDHIVLIERKGYDLGRRKKQRTRGIA